MTNGRLLKCAVSAIQPVGVFSAQRHWLPLVHEQHESVVPYPEGAAGSERRCNDTPQNKQSSDIEAGPSADCALDNHVFQRLVVSVPQDFHKWCIA